MQPQINHRQSSHCKNQLQIKSMTAIKKIFANQEINEKRLKQVEALVDPITKYIIAITPRSGSSHLCDVLKNTQALGRPGELLPKEFIPNILKRAPARTPDDYLQNVLKVLQSDNGVSGLKASWFQFNTFCQDLENPSILRQFKYIYLTRKDTAAQAVSLYAATESSVFHTNKSHADEAIEKLEKLQYDFEKIAFWHHHISVQEEGWMRFFATDILPLHISYEEIDNDVASVGKQIAAYLGVKDARIDAMKNDSIFNKIGDSRNTEWTQRYLSEAGEKSKKD